MVLAYTYRALDDLALDHRHRVLADNGNVELLGERDEVSLLELQASQVLCRILTACRTRQPRPNFAGVWPGKHHRCPRRHKREFCLTLNELIELIRLQLLDNVTEKAKDRHREALIVHHRPRPPISSFVMNSSASSSSSRA